jgi:hypothetical protein
MAECQQQQHDPSGAAAAGGVSALAGCYLGGRPGHEGGEQEGE